MKGVCWSVLSKADSQRLSKRKAGSTLTKIVSFRIYALCLYVTLIYLVFNSLLFHRIDLLSTLVVQRKEHDTIRLMTPIDCHTSIVLTTLEELKK